MPRQSQRQGPARGGSSTRSPPVCKSIRGGDAGDVGRQPYGHAGGMPRQDGDQHVPRSQAHPAPQLPQPHHLPPVSYSFTRHICWGQALPTAKQAAEEGGRRSHRHSTGVGGLNCSSPVGGGGGQAVGTGGAEPLTPAQGSTTELCSQLKPTHPPCTLSHTMGPMQQHPKALRGCQRC